MKKTLLILGTAAYLAACQSPKQDATEQVEETPAVAVKEKRTFPENLTKVLDAHGGYDAWDAMNQLSYTRGAGDEAEEQLIELKSRRVLLSSANYQIGFDGTDVWISPADAEFRSSPRFYHNLYFYFYAMPFVLADPGINYSDVEPLLVDDVQYPGIKISYNAGVGDAPKDNYILYYNPENYQMAFLQYTVTYRSQETSDKYSLIKYGSWADVNGLILPTKLSWYKYEDGKLGELRNEAEFSNIKLSADVPADDIFAKPQDAKVSEAPKAD